MTDWTIVAQKGDDAGSGTVTNVSADVPLSVTNPTTTPNISLGIVPATKAVPADSPGAPEFSAQQRQPVGERTFTAPDIPAGSGHYIQNIKEPASA